MSKTCKRFLLTATAYISACALSAIARAENEEERDRAFEEELLEQIIVTGTRIPRPDVESNSPITTLESELFTVGTETNVVRQLQKLPQFSPARSPNSGDTSAFTGSFIDLRGLDRQRTLTLVNGRRWVNTISDGGVDLSTIPPELIERVDVVTGGASATYGSDAVAGVVNFILKDDFDGLEFNVQSGLTEMGESTNTRFSATGGTTFSNGRGSSYFHTSWDETKLILADDRDALVPDVRNVDGVFVPASNQTVGSGSALVSEDLAQFGPGGELFQAPGVLNPLTEDEFFYPGSERMLQNPADKVMLAAGLRYNLTERISFNMDGLYVRDEIRPYREPYAVFLDSFDIPVDNPFIGPLTQDYLETLDADGDGLVNIPGFSRRLNELGPVRVDATRDSYHIGAGFNFDLGNGWELEAFATYSESTYSAFTRNIPHSGRLAQALDVIDGPDGPECRTAFFGDLPCVPLNVFGEGTISPEAAAFINTEGGIYTRNTDFDAQVIVTGTPFHLPAGAVGFAAGVEQRYSEASETPNEVWRTGVQDGVQAAGFSAKLEQTEGFAELMVPILFEAPFAQYLGLELGARFTEFSPGADAWTYKVLGNWSPVETVKFRGGFQRATRAPNPFELGASDQLFLPLFFLGDDPCFTGAPLTGDLRSACIANGVPAAVADAGSVANPFSQIFFSFLGNTDLEPEEANTYSIGVVLDELVVEDLTISIDYYNIDLEQTIGTFPLPAIIDGCLFSGPVGEARFCKSLGRHPTTGQLNAFTLNFENVGRLQTEGIDIGLNYVTFASGIFRPTASYSLNVVATYLLDFVTAPFEEEPDVEFDCDGLFGVACGNPRPKWKSTTRLAWEEGPVTTALSWSWVGDVTNDAREFDPGTPRAVTDIDAQHYLDIDAVWRISEMFELRGGISNLTNTEPPIVGSDIARSNTFLGQYDAIGRRYFIGARVKY